ncbi:conserved hypothetical protein [uncultured Desulfobacterium sp.]|uniref:Radical SAM core domain-containing protein n=1 Tax=uncultured Desulfobacterium sp. TaxID=201089 RepID=A0A445MRX0_9BACT|nr:conserved hypothetical protein [uncultured Desulfobacterium sp.]
MLIDQSWFPNIRCPSRYLGHEIGSIKKDTTLTEVSIALAFPDVYEVGMSHLGLKILYHILNSHQWLAAERVFCPWTDMEEALRHNNLPLTSLESNRPILGFDIVGFSLQHELCYTNVLTMLDLAGIPLYARQRDHDTPIIIAGGPACFNPEPMAEFFDVMVIGDGEAASLEVCRVVRQKKQEGIKDKEEVLRLLRDIRGVYIPSFFKASYHTEGPVLSIDPLYPEYPHVNKAIVSDIDNYPYPVSQIVPYTELVHDRLAIEVSRGCTRGCRFCQAGIIYRPVRERSPDSVIDKAQLALKLTGYEDLSLLSLSSGDYSCIGAVLKNLMDILTLEKVSISLPSLRVDSLNSLMVEQIKRVRKTGFTLALEAGSERLRKAINKGLTTEEILNMARVVYGAGWNLIKLYFMIGLPSEEERDLEDIVDLSRRISEIPYNRGGRARLNISISTFVPKSHTPFMWVNQIALEESKRRIQLIRTRLQGSLVHVKWNQPELSWLEGIFSRGDRRLSRTILEAWKLGAKFDAWTEHFKINIWQEALLRSGVDAGFYLLRKRDFDEVLPWDHIQSGVSKAFLKNEMERAEKGLLTPDCRQLCVNCGVCDHKAVKPVLFTESSFQPKAAGSHIEPAIQLTGKFRLIFTKLKTARHLSHLELVRVFIRAFKRAGLRLSYSKGFHPMPKISFASALPVGTESITESADIEISEASDPSYIKRIINKQLPFGIKVIAVTDISQKKKNTGLSEIHYLISLSGNEANGEAINRFFMSDHFPVVKTTKKGDHTIDARPLVKSLAIISPNKLKLILKNTEGPKLKPEKIIAGVFSLRDLGAGAIKTLKIKQVLGD